MGSAARILDFKNVLSWASSRVIRSACISLRTQSIHLPLGFPLVFFLALSTALTSLFSSILCICPYQRSLISLTFSCMLFITSSFLLSTLFTLSLSLCNCVHYKDFKVMKEFLFFTICDTKECVHYKEFKVLKECLFFTIWDTKESISGAIESISSERIQ